MPLARKEDKKKGKCDYKLDIKIRTNEIIHLKNLGSWAFKTGVCKISAEGQQIISCDDSWSKLQDEYWSWRVAGFKAVLFMIPHLKLV